MIKVNLAKIQNNPKLSLKILKKHLSMKVQVFKYQYHVKILVYKQILIMKIRNNIKITECKQQLFQNFKKLECKRIYLNIQILAFKQIFRN